MTVRLGQCCQMRWHRDMYLHAHFLRRPLVCNIIRYIVSAILAHGMHYGVGFNNLDSHCCPCVKEIRKQEACAVQASPDKHLHLPSEAKLWLLENQGCDSELWLKPCLQRCMLDGLL